MEQRNSERKEVSIDAVVACTRFGLIRGEIVDMGIGGLYIRAETRIVPIGSDVSVTFQPGAEIWKGCLTLEGRVSHQSLQGFGIAFGDISTECLASLETLLLDRPTVPQCAPPALRAV